MLLCIYNHIDLMAAAHYTASDEVSSDTSQLPQEYSLVCRARRMHYPHTKEKALRLCSGRVTAVLNVKCEKPVFNCTVTQTVRCD